MAVQARYNITQHGPRAPRAWPEVDDTTWSALFLGEPGGGHELAAVEQRNRQQAVGAGGCTGFSDPRSALTCNHNSSDNDINGWLVRSKRARVGDGLMIMESHGGALLPPVPVAALAGNAQSRALCSGAASTSGRAPVASHGLVSSSHLYRHGVEADALIRIQNERLRVGLEEARRRHVRAAVSALETAAARRLREAEAELERALARNAELEETLRQTSAEMRAWQGVAGSHEAVAAGLRVTLDEITMQSPPCATGGEGEAEDAQSCCFQDQDRQEANAARAATRACRACGEAGACVLLLPCRHLCLCAACEPAVDACPVCAAAKNASLHVLLS